MPLKEAVRHATPCGAQAASCHEESQDDCHVAWLWRWLVATFAWMTAYGKMDGHTNYIPAEYQAAGGS